MNEVETKLSQFSALSQKDKGPAYQTLLSDILARPHPASIPSDLRIFVNAVVNQDNAGLVVGRQVLSELVRMLGEGILKDHELRKRVVEDTLAIVQPRIVSYEEQVRVHFVGTYYTGLE
jgi:COP9 signalosome complex subunit 4